jgi:hypothetical protein
VLLPACQPHGSNTSDHITKSGAEFGHRAPLGSDNNRKEQQWNNIKPFREVQRMTSIGKPPSDNNGGNSAKPLAPWMNPDAPWNSPEERKKREEAGKQSLAVAQAVSDADKYRHAERANEAAVKEKELILDIEKLRLRQVEIKAGELDVPGAPRQLLGRLMSEVQPRALDWVWIGWIVRKYITLFVGESGAGKSTVLADIVARITTGLPWPGETEQRRPGRVLWLASEDGAADMTVPRLMACNADRERVIEIEAVRQGGRLTTFSMQDDIEAVKEWLVYARDVQNDPFTALVIDPVTSYLPGRRLRKVDMNDSGQLRTILEPWFKVAQESNIAPICVTHFNKDETRSMLHRVTGSAVFAQTCRSLCAMIECPDDGEFQKAMVQVKTNLPEHPGGAWRFETKKVKVGDDPVNHNPINATRPIWIEKDETITPRSVMGGKRGPVGADVGAGFAIWLKFQFLTTDLENGLPITQIRDAAFAAKICSKKWWEEHSGKYLQKRNDGGKWMCKPAQ